MLDKDHDERERRAKRLPRLVAVIGIMAATLAPEISGKPPSASVGDTLSGRTIEVDLGDDRWAPLGRPGAEVVIEQIAVGDGGVVLDLELERFSVTRPDTRFVLGQPGPGDSFTALPYDPSRIAIYRGRARGFPGSHVFLAVSGDRTGVSGYLDLPSSAAGEGGRYRFSSGGGPGSPGQMSSRLANLPGALPPGTPLCGLGATSGGGGGGFRPNDPRPTAGTRVIELAIETDYEFFTLFGDLDAAADYLTILYAAVSDIYLRDVDARFELTFVRLWDDPNDLFNEESPLGPFRSYWNANMTQVQRDVAQFLSGRRDFPYGGAAYLSSLCGTNAYSVVGYALGVLPETEPSVLNYDVHVTAHELGHNVGALHTHSYGIDTCDDLNGVPQRGSIMSYCSQTVSGGNANTDLRFHAEVQQVVEDYLLTTATCLDTDCNNNGVDDGDDIQGGTSDDLNANGVPDECEDCNGNGVLDDQDILAGTSLDLNTNGVPDDCEPDCNGNGVPDDADIAAGTSFDLHGNGIPDECEADCDGDGQPDYNEIQSDMSLDVNRNTVLDACEDCDSDGTIDRDALAGSHDVWVASTHEGTLRELHATTGVLMQVTAAGQISSGQDVVIDDAGRIFVSSADDHRVVEFDRFGAYVGDFVTAGSGGLLSPTGLALAPGGNLLVSSRDTNSVLEYDGQSGAFLGAPAAAGSGGLAQPHGIAFGPNGNFFVTSSTNEVLEYDATSGGLVGVFVSAADNGGLLDPRGLAFKPDGNLLVASHATNQVLEFDGQTGAFVGQFNHGGTDTALTLDGPWGVRIGPDGQVYVSRHLVGPAGPPGGSLPEDSEELHINSSRIYIFDANGGNFIRSYVLGNDTDLWLPTGFDFYPGSDLDCNRNAFPDSCDIAAGTSGDVNNDGIPDECQCLADIDGSGSVDVLDLIELLVCFGQPALPACGPSDINADGTVNVLDLITLLLDFGAGCR